MSAFLIAEIHHATLSACGISVVLMTTSYGYASIFQISLEEFITIPWSEVCLLSLSAILITEIQDTQQK
jgi:hypothetical protein